MDVPTTTAQANTSIANLLPVLLDIRAAASLVGAGQTVGGENSSYKLFDVKDVPAWNGKDNILPWLRGFRDFCNGYTVRSGDVQAAIFRCKARITQEPGGSWFQETDAGTFVRLGEDGRPDWAPSWLAFATHLENLLVPRDWYEKAAEAWAKLKVTAALGRADDFTDFKTRFMDGLNKYNVARRARGFGTLGQHETTMKFVECLPPGVYDEVNLKYDDVLSQAWNHYDRDLTIAWAKVKGHRSLALEARAEEAEAFQANVRRATREYLEAEADFLPRKKMGGVGAPRQQQRCILRWEAAPAHLRGPLTPWEGMSRPEYDAMKARYEAIKREGRCASCRGLRATHGVAFTPVEPWRDVKVPRVRQGPAEEEEEAEDLNEENS